MPARELPGRDGAVAHPDVEARDGGDRGPAAPPGVHEGAAAELLERREGEVLAERLAEQQAFALAIFAQVDERREAVAHAAKGGGAAVEHDLPAGGPQADEALEGFGARRR